MTTSPATPPAGPISSAVLAEFVRMLLARVESIDLDAAHLDGDEDLLVSRVKWTGTPGQYAVRVAHGVKRYEIIIRER